MITITRVSLAAVLFASACSMADSDDTAGSDEITQISGADANAVEAILKIEDHRLFGSSELAAYLKHPHAVVAAAAATAVGRIGDVSLQPDLIKLLGSKDASVREAAALGIELTGGAAAEAPLIARLDTETDSNVRAALLTALGHVGTAASTPVLVAAITGPHAPVLEQGAAAQSLYLLSVAKIPLPTDADVLETLLALATGTNQNTAAQAALAVTAFGTALAPYETAITTGASSAPSLDARSSLVKALGTLTTPTAVQALATITTSDKVDRIRAGAATTLAAQGASPVALAALTSALSDSASGVVVNAAGSLASLGAGAASALPALNAAYTAGGIGAQVATLAALVAIDPASAEATVNAALSGPFDLRNAAVGELGVIASATSLATLTTLINDPDPRIEQSAMNAVSFLTTAQVTPAMRAACHAALLAAPDNFEVVNGAVFTSATFGWTEFAADLDASYPLMAGEYKMWGRADIALALGYIGSTADLPILQEALKDPELTVVQQAAAAYQMLTGTDVSSMVPPASTVTSTTPSWAQIQRAQHAQVVLETSRGTMKIKLSSAAPLNAVNFVELADSGFYDGLGFDRVIPNHLSQGGDPLHDGYGNSQSFVRDEVSALPMVDGSVGLATAGKDTGSCQFFFNLTRNSTLEGSYTLFGQLETTESTINALEMGDAIEHAYVIPDYY